VPPPFRASSPRDVIDVIRRNPLATVISAVDDTLLATHCAVVMESGWETRTESTFAGSTLLGHMNRSNEHWHGLKNGSRTLVVFQGSAGYVCPTVYDCDDCAPTWNFVAVHARGVLEHVSTGDDTLAVVMETVAQLEREFGAGWDMSASLDHFRRISPGVGAFRIAVQTVESMFKLSQDQPQTTRVRIADRLSATSHARADELAEQIRCPSQRTD
jgi:transcriptional regulator